MLQTLVRTVDRSGENTNERFERLMRSTYRQAHALASRLSGSSAEAEDLVQEAYIRAFRFFHRYDETLPFTSWLYRILANVHIDSVRRKSRLKTISLETNFTESNSTRDLPDEAAAPDRVLLDDMVDETVQFGLQSMTAEFRIAVLLADVEGMAYEEIAEVMQTSVGTVRSRIHRGRKQLREYLRAAAPDRFREVAR